MPYCGGVARRRQPLTGGRLAAARALQVWRAGLEMSLAEVAAEAGVAETQVGEFERGQRWPQALTRVRIEKALGKPPGEFQRIADQWELDQVGGDPDELAVARSAELDEHTKASILARLRAHRAV